MTISEAVGRGANHFGNANVTLNSTCLGFQRLFFIFYLLIGCLIFFDSKKHHELLFFTKVHGV